MERREEGQSTKTAIVSNCLGVLTENVARTEESKNTYVFVYKEGIIYLKDDGFKQLNLSKIIIDSSRKDKKKTVFVVKVVQIYIKHLYCETEPFFMECLLSKKYKDFVNNNSKQMSRSFGIIQRRYNFMVNLVNFYSACFMLDCFITLCILL